MNQITALNTADATPATLSERNRFANLTKLHNDLGRYLACLDRTGGRQDEQADWNELEVLQGIQLCFEDPVEAEANLRHELRIDDEGYPLDDEGDRLVERVAPMGWAL
jgi:hypothetical protein